MNEDAGAREKNTVAIAFVKSVFGLAGCGFELSDEGQRKGAAVRRGGWRSSCVAQHLGR